MESEEIWGHPPFGSNIPKVQAYVGPLPSNSNGIQFRTDLEPDPGCPPGRAEWSREDLGVRVDNDCAKIPVTIELVRQSA